MITAAVVNNKVPIRSENRWRMANAQASLQPVWMEGQNGISSTESPRSIKIFLPECDEEGQGKDLGPQGSFFPRNDGCGRRGSSTEELQESTKGYFGTVPPVTCKPAPFQLGVCMTRPLRSSSSCIRRGPVGLCPPQCLVSQTAHTATLPHCCSSWRTLDALVKSRLSLSCHPATPPSPPKPLQAGPSSSWRPSFPATLGTCASYQV